MKRISSVAILGVLMGYLPLLPADERKSSESNPKTEQRTNKFNVTGPTAGGKQFWTDLFIYDSWRIQRNVFTGHCRLLDDENQRRSWGTFENCRRKFDELKGELQLPRMGSEVVITVHGLGRTRDSMAGIGRYLAEAGGYTWINVSYASTRDRVDAHAKALESIVHNLEGVEKIDFVAHSMGNLLLRHYLADQAAATKHATDGPRLGRIVMLAPPNNGSALAARFKDNKLFRFIFGVSGTQLADQWKELEERLATPRCQFGIVAGSHSKGLATNPLLVGDDDFVVSVDETRLAGAHDFLVVPALHTFIMDDPQVRKCTLQFLQNGHFISEEKRQPIVAPANTGD
jgi:pimeloyl-ACP methyl ester carboxylesterase